MENFPIILELFQLKVYVVTVAKMQNLLNTEEFEVIVSDFEHYSEFQRYPKSNKFGYYTCLNCILSKFNLSSTSKLCK